MILNILVVEVGSKIRSKIDKKMKSRWEGILASIFHGFWSILEAKMAPSWGRVSMKNRSQKGIDKHMRKENEKIGSPAPLGGLLAPLGSPDGTGWGRQ